MRLDLFYHNMREFDIFEVAGTRYDCLTCLVLGDKREMKREVKLLHGDMASVKFSCEGCGFVKVGLVNLSGQEQVVEQPVVLNRPHIVQPDPTPEPVYQHNPPPPPNGGVHITAPRNSYNSPGSASVAVDTSTKLLRAFGR